MISFFIERTLLSALLACLLVFLFTFSRYTELAKELPSWLAVPVITWPERRHT